MSERQLPARREGCTAPQWSTLVVPYCFGDLDQEQRDSFEVHLLECDSCWKQVDALDPAVEVLRTRQYRSDRGRPRLVFAEMLERAFGGHVSYVLPICIAYAALFSVAVLLELAFDFQQYYSLLIVLAPLAFLWMFLTTMVGLAVDWKLTLAGRPNGLLFNLSLHTGAAVVLYVTSTIYLPSVSSVQADFQTFTAQTGYLKSIIHLLLLSIFFWLPSFHFVISMQREILGGRHQMVLAVLTNDPHALTPRGTMFPRLSWLVPLWILLILLRVGGAFYLFNHLTPHPNLNLFMNLAVVHQFLFFLLGTGCLLWYSRALDLLKRECLALLALQSRSHNVSTRGH